MCPRLEEIFAKPPNKILRPVEVVRTHTSICYHSLQHKRQKNQEEGAPHWNRRFERRTVRKINSTPYSGEIDQPQDLASLEVSDPGIHREHEKNLPNT